MAVIDFSDRPEEIWCVASWAFRQVLDDVMSLNLENLVMAEQFYKAKLFSGLHMGFLEPNLADTITKAMEQVAIGTLSGEFRSGIYAQPYGDENTLKQYCIGLEQLLEVIASSNIRCRRILNDVR